MSIYQAYLGFYNTEVGVFLPRSFLGDFNSREDAIAAYKLHRSDDSPHVKITKMNEIVESCDKCPVCNTNGVFKTEVITEITE